jgi:rhamnogalacturonan endolyase
MTTTLPRYSIFLLRAAFGFCLLLGMICGQQAQAQMGPRQMEYLTRGLIAVPATDHVFLSWRMLATDSPGVSFNLYRDGSLVNNSVITGVSHYQDSSGTAESLYYLETIHSGGDSEISTPVSVWEDTYLTVPTQTPAGYSINDASVADLDGDGELEVVVKMEGATRDNSQSGVTDPVYLHAYRLNGEFLWSINLGINIRGGAHYTQFMVYDLDGDGKAEVACKTAPGTTDGRGTLLGTGPAANDDDAADYRNGNGYILSGPEYVTVFEGISGAEISTVDYLPPRHPSTLFPSGGQINSIWGDSYGNRVDRFLAGVAYFEATPSLVMCRGYYTRTALTAYDFDGDTLTVRWQFDTHDDPTLNEYRGQGAHSLSIGDADGDGKDEIMYGAMTVDDDGSPLNNTNFQHGDATHFSDLIPSRPGLEFFMPHESAGYTHGGVVNPALHVRDANTGEIIWQIPGTGDFGRGMTADITASQPGNEFWVSGGLGVFNSSGTVFSNVFPSINFAAWWDGDLSRELLDGNRVDKWTPTGMQNLLTATGAASNNGTKSTPSLSGDILGDWREEVMLRASDNQSLRIYSTTIPTTYGFYTLLQDPHYRLALTWQNVGYNQPPHPGFFLGNDMVDPPTPDIQMVPPSTALRIQTPRDQFVVGLGLDLDVIVHAVELADTNQSVFLSLDGAPFDTLPGPPYLTTVSGLTSGQYVLVASGYDADGQLVQSSPVTFTVDLGFPSINLMSPLQNALYAPSDSVPLMVVAADPNGSVDSVVFLLDETPIRTLSQSPYSFKIGNPGIGLHTAQAIAYDNEGNSTLSAVVEFAVGVAITIQEEETGFCGFSNGAGTIDNNHTGFTGTGFANTDNIANVRLGWAVDFPVSGAYRLTWRYASASDRPGRLLLDLDQVLDTIALSSTVEWTNWTEGSTTIEAPSGLHLLTLEAIGESGLANLDYLQVTSLVDVNGAAAGDCESIPLSVNKTSAILRPHLFPVPTSDQLQVVIPDGQQEIEDIALYRLDGALVQSHHQIRAARFTLNLRGVPSGIYLVRISSRDGVFTQKVQVMP